MELGVTWFASQSHCECHPWGASGYDIEILYRESSSHRIKEVPVQRYCAEASTVNPISDSWQDLSDVIRVCLRDWQAGYRHASAAKGYMRGSATTE